MTGNRSNAMHVSLAENLRSLHHRAAVFLLTAWLRSSRRGDSCFNCRGPSNEDLRGGYYEAGGSFLKLGPVASFLVRLTYNASAKLAEVSSP